MSAWPGVRYEPGGRRYAQCPACGVTEGDISCFIIENTSTGTTRAVSCRQCLDLLTYLLHLERFLSIAVSYGT